MRRINLVVKSVENIIPKETNKPVSATKIESLFELITKNKILSMKCLLLILAALAIIAIWIIKKYKEAKRKNRHPNIRYRNLNTQDDDMNI